MIPIIIAAIADHSYVLEVSAGIVRSKGKILAMKKGQSKYEYLSFRYEFPGGKIEPGEIPIDTLKREFQEELKANLDGAVIKQMRDVYFEYPDFSVRIYPFLIDIEAFEFKLTEHVDYQWLDLKSINSVDWVAADKIIVEEVAGVDD